MYAPGNPGVFSCPQPVSDPRDAALATTMRPTLLARSTGIVVARILAIGVLATSCLAVGGCCVNEQQPDDPEPPRFARDIRPIFVRHCTRCHGENDDFQAGLDLRSVDSMIVGGSSGPAIVPGDPGGSLVLQMIGDDGMPPEGRPVSTQDIARIERWITGGAHR